MYKELSTSEELDFQYLLQLLPPLEDTPEFANLPELFSLIGAKSLIKLCKYAGGETITLPTLEQLCQDIEALQWYYDVYVKKTKSSAEIPLDLKELVSKIYKTYL